MSGDLETVVREVAGDYYFSLPHSTRSGARVFVDDMLELLRTPGLGSRVREAAAACEADYPIINPNPFQENLRPAIFDCYTRSARPHPRREDMAAAARRHDRCRIHHGSGRGCAAARRTACRSLRALVEDRTSPLAGGGDCSQSAAAEAGKALSLLKRNTHMSQSQNALGVGLSGLIGLALDADLSRSEIADELRRAAELLSPSQRVRFAMAEGERMSIDPTLDEPMPMREAMPLDPRQDGEFGAGAFPKC